LRWFCIIFISLLSLQARCQYMDTLHEVFKHKGSIDARLESRFSFYSNTLISVSGVRLGVAFHRKLRMGGGISWLKTEVPKAYYITTAEGEELKLFKRPKFVYLCYYIDFVFYKTKRWQLSVPIQAGGGYCWHQAERGYAFGNNNPKYFLFLYEPGITVQYKVFKWAGLGADVAYRFAYSTARKSDIRLNSPTYSFKLLFWPDLLYYDLFPNSELTKRFGPSYW